ncbi:MAG: hypothetical protein MUQ10_18890, partial [Anaerolineae bacterium]|nr:hypothetical protein [Anaerolineae bacterium]
MKSSHARTLRAWLLRASIAASHNDWQLGFGLLDVCCVPFLQPLHSLFFDLTPDFAELGKRSSSVVSHYTGSS